ncbi:hypothetical protein BAUCODRAFT_69323 [Baudoinia panamericana UAMH 10762]|uniref:DUF7703 domain-containing protein n=1 Tax=Baudoinia panamericana (strain UAMH 10762) TaxID=717646 RepID=M2MJZ0_BAUPA|nr:uncharacterized protein BAUCODRAFT_69323 [Baudoinia panamericana UAMH 10762]EMC96996.1 hypothetical protein BAUCODRAFT_69323 [Baudoinia panamericana UAMH 10762]
MTYNHGLISALKTSDNLFNGIYSVTSVTVTIACALALYNVLELILLILTTFRRFGGLYFWSLIVATCGILLYTIGVLILYFQFSAQLTGLAIRVLGWPAMVTGQSLVLYSRLGTVLGRGYDNLKRAVKWVIIVDAVVHHSGTIILTFGAYYASPSHAWIHAYNTQHKVQRTFFCVQECLLSALYIWRAIDILRSSLVLAEKRSQVHLVMFQLIVISLVIEALDVYLLVDEYTALQAIKQAVKAMVYSIKLKLEFATLNKLIDVTESRSTVGRIIAVADHAEKHVNQAPVRGLPFDNSRRSPEPDLEKASGDASILVNSVVRAHPQEVRTATNGALSVPQLPAATVEERSRRRTMDEDLYAGACKAVAGQVEAHGTDTEGD